MLLSLKRRRTVLLEQAMFLWQHEHDQTRLNCPRETPRLFPATTITLGLMSNLLYCSFLFFSGGGEVDSATGVCTDTPLTFDPPIRWFDSVGQDCDWYAASPQSRCIDFANERNAVLGLTLGEGCCACKNVEPPDDPTCKDLSGWTTAGGNTCSSLTREDCLRSTENFGITARTACCKCKLVFHC